MNKPSSFRVSNSIACVVLSYNKPEITKRCLASCLNFFAEASIFLIHNGTLQKHESSLRHEFTNINHLKIPQNLGYSGGAQFGIQSIFVEHNFQMCFFITNDCELLSFPQLNPETMAMTFFAGGCLLRKDLAVECTFGAVNLANGRLRHLKILQETIRPEEKYIPGHFFLIARETWFKLGGFDTTLHTYWEDVDLSLRAIAQQISLTHLPDLRVQHSGGKTTRGNPFYSLFLFQRNRKRITKRHTDNQFLFLIYFYFDLLKLVLKHLRRKQIENLKLFWKILCDENT
jgi:GT2 family glycosyltransferase